METETFFLAYLKIISNSFLATIFQQLKKLQNIKKT